MAGQFKEYCKHGDLKGVRDCLIGLQRHMLSHGYTQEIKRAKFTGLLMAVKGGHTEVVRLLLHDDNFNPNKPCWRRGDADVPQITDLRETPLHQAAIREDTACLQILLSCERIKPNVKNREGRTPLMEAIRRGRQGAVEMLLNDNRVFPNNNTASSSKGEIKDLEGKTALALAVESNQRACIELLLPRSDLQTRDYHKRSAMEVAR